MGTLQLFLELKQNSAYKATFGVNKFEYIRSHLQFDEKKTGTERLHSATLKVY